MKHVDFYNYLLKKKNRDVIFEVDLIYPKSLHDLHNDYPLAPEQLKVTSDMVSDYSKNLKEKIGPSDKSTKKSVSNLVNKKNYIVHHEILKLYVDLGLKITKVHRVL